MFINDFVKNTLFTFPVPSMPSTDAWKVLANVLKNQNMIKLFPYYFIHSLKKAICNARTFVKVKTKSRHTKRELSPLGTYTCAIGDVLMREWGLTQTRVGTNSSSSPLKIQTIPNGMDSIRQFGIRSRLRREINQILSKSNKSLWQKFKRFDRFWIDLLDLATPSWGFCPKGHFLILFAE